jgi:hypothetical protein
MAKNLFSILSVLLALGCCLVFGAEESAIPNNNQRSLRGQVEKEALNHRQLQPGPPPPYVFVEPDLFVEPEFVEPEFVGPGFVGPVVYEPPLVPVLFGEP